MLKSWRYVLSAAMVLGLLSLPAEAVPPSPIVTSLFVPIEGDVTVGGDTVHLSGEVHVLTQVFISFDSPTMVSVYANLARVMGTSALTAISYVAVGAGSTEVTLAPGPPSSVNNLPAVQFNFMLEAVGLPPAVLRRSFTLPVSLSNFQWIVEFEDLGTLVGLEAIFELRRHIYWSDGRGLIGRADVDGTNVDRFFITGLDSPYCCPAVDSGHIYWAVLNVDAPAIGRASLDGTNVDHTFITGLGRPIGVAVDSSYIYWGAGFAPATIGRASLDGTNVDHFFITGVFQPEGVAVDSGHIYWAQRLVSGAGAIGRANLDGTNVDHTLITGLPLPQGVAIDSGHIYWGDAVLYAIFRANLDGTNALGFITELVKPVWVAVDPG